MAVSTRLTTASFLLSLFGCSGGSEQPLVQVTQLPDCEVLTEWTVSERVNGTPLLPEHIQKFTLNYFNDETIVNLEIGPEFRQWLFLGLKGTMSFRINVTNTEGQVSDWSNTTTEVMDDAC